MTYRVLVEAQVDERSGIRHVWEGDSVCLGVRRAQGERGPVDPLVHRVLAARVVDHHEIDFAFRDDQWSDGKSFAHFAAIDLKNMSARNTR